MNKTVGTIHKEHKFNKLIVQIENPEVKSRYGNFTFKSKNIILLNVYPTGDEFQIIYDDLDTGKQDAKVVPSEFVLSLLSEEKQKELKFKYKEEIVRKQLHKYLNFGYHIGADPEIFVTDENNKLIPAFDFLQSKDAKKSFSYGETYWDGFQTEFTVSPGTCMDGLTERLKYGLMAILDQARAKNPKAKLSSKTVMDIPFDLIQNSKPEHVAFGCMPSLNAYGMKGVEGDGREILYRTTGGHIHFGLASYSGMSDSDGKPIFNNQPKEKMIEMVKAMDAILAVACVSLFATLDEPRRRTMYGLAGEFRMPPHGLEYRTLSSSWLCHPLAANIVFDLARCAAMVGDKGYLRFWDSSEAETIAVINNHDVETARKILKRNEKIFLEIINGRYYDEVRTQYVFKAIMNGIESVVKDPHDIVKNWGLEGGDRQKSVSNLGGTNVRRAALQYKGEKV